MQEGTVLSVMLVEGFHTKHFLSNMTERTVPSCIYLTRWTTPEALETGAMSGAFFETWVVSEITKSYLKQGKRPPLYIYRDKDQKEIDLIIHENDTLYPIEIKKTSNPSRESTKHFQVLEKAGLRVGTGNVICLTSKLLPLDKSNWFVPAWLI